MNKEVNLQKVKDYFGKVISVDLEYLKKHSIYSPLDEPNQQLAQEENYTELNQYLHTEGTSSIRISIDQFFAVIKDKDPDGMFSGTRKMDTTLDLINFSMIKAKKFVDDYEEIYGEPMYCGRAYVQTPKKLYFAKELRKLKLGYDYPDGMWHFPNKTHSQSLDLHMLGAKIQKAILEGYGITDLSIGHWVD
jgi:hypothetical protein